MPRTVRLLHDERMIEHDPGSGHPERPDRLRAIRERVVDDPPAGVEVVAPPEIDREVLEGAHHPVYVDEVLGLEGERARLGPDTAVSPGSVPAARLAAGATVEAVRTVLDGEAEASWALGRPPGHHAEAARAMGFCLFSNVAVAALEALRLGAEQVLVCDWDVHHGNGTQHLLEDRADVTFLSIHRFPFYPGTGDLDEIGRDEGVGHTVNVAWPGGRTSADWVHAIRAVLAPVADVVEPDLVLVSAGFDAHEADPLGGMGVTTGGFAAACAAVRAIADRHADGRVALALEGGYDLDGLASSVRACVEVLTGEREPPEVGEPTPEAREVVDRVLAIHRERGLLAPG